LLLAGNSLPATLILSHNRITFECVEREMKIAQNVMEFASHSREAAQPMHAVLI
jgi:hypothetical protein